MTDKTSGGNADHPPEGYPFLEGELADVVVNFVDQSGEIIANWRSPNPVIPSVNETVSFGELQTPSEDRVSSSDAKYKIEELSYIVIDVEYIYTDVVVTEEVEEPKDSVEDFVNVVVYLEELTTSPS